MESNNIPDASPSKQELIQKINKHLGYDYDHMRISNLPVSELDLISKMLNLKPKM
jgi:hypothetical protein